MNWREIVAEMYPKSSHTRLSTRQYLNSLQAGDPKSGLIATMHIYDRVRKCWRGEVVVLAVKGSGMLDSIFMLTRLKQGWLCPSIILTGKKSHQCGVCDECWIEVERIKLREL